MEDLLQNKSLTGFNHNDIIIPETQEHLDYNVLFYLKTALIWKNTLKWADRVEAKKIQQKS
ncbi:MAG: hypothetical protein JEZ06_20270 [Anaerolineaceae bacterium]|nr:hypothetical protein [Anaerolineaceae bacterium]